MKMTAAEFRTPKANKYGAKKTVVDGITFDSKAEASYYAILKMRERAGEVYGVELQPRFPIIMNSIVCAAARMDFQYWDQREKRQVVVDVKGMDTPVSKLKRKLVEAQYGIKIDVVKK